MLAHGDPDVVVREILKQPVFRNAPPSASHHGGPSLWETAWGWFVQHVLHPLFAPLAHALVLSRGVGTAAGVALIAVALAGLGFVSVRLALAFATGRRAFARDSGTLHALIPERSSTQWRALGAAAAAAGEHAEAIAAFFAAALASLDEHAVVAFGASRAPGEYRRLVRCACATAAPPFDDLTQCFCRAIYGAVAPQSDDSAQAERALDALEPALNA